MCPIGYQQREQKYPAHNSEPRQKALNAIHVLPLRTRVPTCHRRHLKIRVGWQRYGAEGHKETRGREAPENRDVIKVAADFSKPRCSNIGCRYG